MLVLMNLIKMKVSPHFILQSYTSQHAALFIVGRHFIQVIRIVEYAAVLRDNIISQIRLDNYIY